MHLLCETPAPTNNPGPTSTPLITPTPITGASQTVIDYIYDPLYRLTEANYSTGDYYHYTYDAVGNRLTQTTQLSVTSYQYDVANRLTDVNGVPYTWDDNGNLLNDGVNTYAYDSANRLTAISGGQSAAYGYNGLGDRLSQNGVNYTLDLNAGLTQVLNDGTNTYLYGTGRIAQVNTGTDYFLTDALGSARQLTTPSQKTKSQSPVSNSPLPFSPYTSVSLPPRSRLPPPPRRDTLWKNGTIPTRRCQRTKPC